MTSSSNNASRLPWIPCGSYEARRIVFLAIACYLFAHLVCYIYSIVAVYNTRRMFERKELYDGPLLLRENGKPAFWGTKYSKAVMLNAAVFFDEPAAVLSRTGAPSFVDHREATLSRAFLTKLSLQARILLARSEASRSENDASRSENDASRSLLYVTFVSDAQVKLTLNWLCNVEPFKGSLDRSLIISSSRKLCRDVIKHYPQVACMVAPIPSWYASRVASRLSHTDLEWQQLQARLMLYLTEESFSFVFFEVASLWFRDPLSFFLQQTAVDDADVVVPVYGVPAAYLAFHPLLVFPTNGSIQLFSEMSKRLAKEHTGTNMRGSAISLTLAELCPTQFNGVVCRRFEWEEIAPDNKWWRLDEERRRQHRHYIVNVYGPDPEMKMSLLKMRNLWLLESSDDSCSVARREEMLRRYGGENEDVIDRSPSKEQSEMTTTTTTSQRREISQSAASVIAKFKLL